ncbi:hypothetical protein F4V57_08755 [Acinetobacter qingfengensis]|uniref:TPM domain-containing protein n=1 Tax=Acinetobacter qingfengensis TaxID=1262585 RepID=A0A1E7R192_9GAMM|nr:TPM domain-containing protein [Acinetobacter qingfengensis]KAA8733304.1 hypothetical protein F4V57_08755 [Acinetobacter qingfengensis]OEY93064.1 hypothetical protein BJI46_04805 [Acinetobacter qingfengensis]
MVNQTDSQTVFASKNTIDTHQLSLTRWLKHVFCFKSSKRLLNAAQCQQIATAIAAAENGHRGEIQIIIEGSLPSLIALDTNVRQRAEQLFAEYRVWDTEFNSGILIYINLCEKKLELVADRGIHQAVHATCWDEICQKMLPYFKQQQYVDGLCFGIEQIGEKLATFYADNQADPKGNELSDLPKLL